MLVSPRYICRSKRSESNILVIHLYSQNEAEREQGTGNSLIFLFAEQSVARAASWQFAYVFIRRTKRGESSVSWQFAYSQNEAKREQRPCNSLIRYSQNEAKREQRPGNSLILYIILNYILTIFFCSQCTTQTIYIKQNKKTATRLDPWEIL